MKKKSNKPLTSPSASQTQTIFDNNKFIYLLLGVSVLFVLLARIHLLSFPLERDEGEYAYMGKLILDGHPPYTLAYNMKLPGVYYMYAIIMTVFGQSTIGIHLGVALIVIASMLLVFLVAGNFVSKVGAVIAAATYGIIGSNWSLYAQAGHATHFVTFFALIGIYILLFAYKNDKRKLLLCFSAGIAFSFSFICKQSGIFFLFFGIAIVFINEFKTNTLLVITKNILVLLNGFAIPVLIMLFYFYMFADFTTFWFWTVKYLSKYGTQVPFSDAFPRFKSAIDLITVVYSSLGYIALWAVSVVAIPFIFINKATLKNKIILFSFLFFSFLTIVPGFHFRNHYFISLLPVIGILIAILFDYLTNLFVHKFKMPKFIYVSFILIAFLFGSGIKANKEYLFKMDNKISSKMAYGSNPFVEAIEIANYLKQHTSKTDKIAILGSEPEIFFYADRYSASGYIYTYNLVETHSYTLSMQKEMAKEIEASKPKYILYVNVNYSWLQEPTSEKYIFTWATDYVGKYYTTVGVMEVTPTSFSSLKTGDQLINYSPQSAEYINIYERKN